MLRMVQAEFAKLVTHRLWLWLLFGSMALAALFTSLSIAFAEVPGSSIPLLSTPEGQQTVFAAAAGGTSLIAILGAIAVTGEFRHQTVTPTFLATPRRARVVIAKLITCAVVGIGYGLACVLTVIAIAVPWLGARGIDVSLTGNGLPQTMLGVLASMAIFALLGVGLGALVRNQVAAVVGLLVYLFVVEPILLAFRPLDPGTRFLPGAASAALVQLAQANQEALGQLQGGLVLAGYALVLAVVGTYLVVRRDVT